MKKIAILTHYYRSKNFGGLLQAYALVNLLGQKGYQARQIPFDTTILSADHKEQAFWLRLRRLSWHKLYMYFWRLWRKPCPQRYVQIQHSLFEKFEQFIMHDPVVFHTSNLAQLNAKYDAFIIGSDQVFASYLLPFNAFWGEFTTPDKQVISYAASSDRKQFDSMAEKLFIQKLSRLNAISVREKTLQEYIQRITHKKATVVLDPTFLLSPQEWLKIAAPKPVPPKPYIFCYFLGGKSGWQRQKAQQYANTYGYEVIHLPYLMQSIRPADKYLKGQGRYDVGPREFIALINQAQCVFTDSFHGLAFSINFGKNFYVFNRDDQNGKNSMNARITDTLATFGLTARHITNQNTVLDNTPLDFTHAHEVLSREKEKSVMWLLNALKD